MQTAGDTFFSSTDTAYLIFLIIGIIGYFTVPSVANYIVNAGGGNGLLQKVNSMVSMASNTSMQSGSAVGSRMASGAINLVNAPGNFMKGWSSAVQSESPNANDLHAQRITGKQES